MVLDITHKKEAIRNTSKPDCQDWNDLHDVNGDVDLNMLDSTIQSKIESVPADLASQLATFTNFISALSGQKIKVPIHIETKEIPAGTTSIVFENLDGDQDVEYKIDGVISLDTTSGDKVIYLAPNGITANQYGSRVFGFRAVNLAANTTTQMILCMNGWGLDSFSQIEAYFYAKTGTHRLYKCEEIVSQTGKEGGQNIRVAWLDSTTVVDSLNVGITAGGSFSGVLSLYKLVEIQL